MKFTLLALTTVFFITACGPVHNRDNEYLDAKNEPHLKMPKGASDSQMKESYPIPAASAQEVQPISLVPPGLEADEAEAEAYLAEQKSNKGK